MSLRIFITAAILLVNALNVFGQSSTASEDLAGFISQVGVIASAFGTPSPVSSAASSTSLSTASSITSSIASSIASSTTPSSTQDPSSNLAGAASTSTPSATSSPSNGGLDPHTRTIIIAVTVPVGLLLLGILIGCLLCCCLRRRRRTRRVASPENRYPETRFAGNDDWARGSHSHHGYVSSDSVRTGHSGAIAPGAQRDSSPLMTEAKTTPRVSTSEHPAYRNSNPNIQNINAANPFTPVPPVARKPVPSRASDGFNGNGNGYNEIGNGFANGTDHHSHNGHPALAAAAGAGLGAAAMHHHNKKHDSRRSYGHEALTSHPSNPNLYTSAPTSSEVEPAHSHNAYRDLDANDLGTETSSDLRDPNRPPTPFGLNAFGIPNKNSSPRPSARRSGTIEPSVAAHNTSYPYAHTADIPTPTEGQRRSLHERDMAFTNDGGADIAAAGVAGAAMHGASGERDSPKRPSPRPGAFHDSTYGSGDYNNSSGTSNESWASANAQRDHHHSEGITPGETPFQTPFEEVPLAHGAYDHHDHEQDYLNNRYSNTSDAPLMPPAAPYVRPTETRRSSGDSQYSYRGVSWGRNSGDSGQGRRLYAPDGSPRRMTGPDGKPRRLRFSDLAQEWHYDADGATGGEEGYAPGRGYGHEERRADEETWGVGRAL